MSFSNTVIKALYTGNGSNTTFAIPFTPIIDDSAETRVVMRDETDPDNITETVLEEGALNDYTLTGAPDADSFHVNVETTFTPTATQKILVIRKLPLTQTLDQGVGSFQPVAQEAAFDRVAAMAQQMQEQINRAPRLPETNNMSAANMTLLEPIAGYLIGWNSDATAIHHYSPAGVTAAAAGILTTDALTEGVTNLYFTTARVQAVAVTSLTGDVTGTGPGATATTIANDAVTNAKAANMADSTIKGRAVGAGTGDPTDLTATQATAILNAFTGDSGSGGVKGQVPAPSSGDAAAGKFLKADGTWSAGTSKSLQCKKFVLAGTNAATLPSDATYGWAIGMGGGGAGGLGGRGTDASNMGGGGGGGGGASVMTGPYVFNFTAGESITVTVGAGGAGSGDDGAASSINAIAGTFPTIYFPGAEGGDAGGVGGAGGGAGGAGGNTLINASSFLNFIHTECGPGGAGGTAGPNNLTNEDGNQAPTYTLLVGGAVAAGGIGGETPDPHDNENGGGGGGGARSIFGNGGAGGYGGDNVSYGPDNGASAATDAYGAGGGGGGGGYEAGNFAGGSGGQGERGTVWIFCVTSTSWEGTV